MRDEKYQFESFLPYKSIAHGISSKVAGSMKSPDTLEIDREALSKFAQINGITDGIVCMKQIHSGSVAFIENLDRLVIPATDGLIANNKRIPLAVLTADCLPILFYDPTKEAIGIAHAGYRGLLNDIIENTIQSFVSHFKSDPKDIVVGIGPSIEMMCYEVGVELIEKFEKVFPEFENIYAQKDGKFYLNLRGIAGQGLAKEGILKEHMEVMDICTKCDQNFYSYRRGDKDMRFVSMISLI